MIGVSLASGAPIHCFMEVIDNTTTETVLDVLERRVNSKIALETDGNPTHLSSVCERDGYKPHSNVIES